MALIKWVIPLYNATRNQMNGITTVIELHVTPEVTPIFREDAMQKPYRYLKKYAHLSTGPKPD